MCLIGHPEARTKHGDEKRRIRQPVSVGARHRGVDTFRRQRRVPHGLVDEHDRELVQRSAKRRTVGTGVAHRGQPSPGQGVIDDENVHARHSNAGFPPFRRPRHDATTPGVEISVAPDSDVAESPDHNKRHQDIAIDRRHERTEPLVRPSPPVETVRSTGGTRHDALEGLFRAFEAIRAAPPVLPHAACPGTTSRVPNGATSTGSAQRGWPTASIRTTGRAVLAVSAGTSAPTARSPQRPGSGCQRWW